MLDDAERLIAYNEEAPVYASIRQAKAKTGMAEELARRIKDGAIPNTDSPSRLQIERPQGWRLSGRATILARRGF